MVYNFIEFRNEIIHRLGTTEKTFDDNLIIWINKYGDSGEQSKKYDSRSCFFIMENRYI